MSNTSSDTSQSRLLSFALDGWTVLGDRVSVSLPNGVGVLVGRNGAGKSAILEGFEAISSLAIGGSNRIRQNDNDSIPKILDIEILTPTARRLKYRYELTTATSDDPNIDDSTNDNSEENLFPWNESCQYADGEEETIWTTETGVTTLNNRDGSSTEIFVNTNLLRLRIPENSQVKPPKEMQWVRAVLKGVRLLGKNPVRQTSKRRSSILKVSSKGIIISSTFYELADRLARKILRRIEKGDLNELESVCQRVGLGSKITIQKFVPTGETREETKGEEYLSSVLLDGVNIGLLSDGTLRVLSILIEIIASYPSATTIIEEPETQIHPGMLAKLLNEIESYTYGENLILSTHSPQVVAWTSPDNINLVHQNDGRTIVRKLREEEIQKVVEYLDEEGDLGEWLYSGIIDE